MDKENQKDEVAVETTDADAKVVAVKLKNEKASAPSKKELEVRASSPRRRAGFSFGVEPTRLKASQLTNEQISLIEGDKELSVKWV